MSLDYTSLITSEHADKPKFSAMVALLAGALGECSDALQSMSGKFDVDVAVGDQLDKVGEWVGIARRLTVPLDIYFSWDIAGRGWDQAVWYGPGSLGSGIVALDDTTYRLVIKSTIAADHWDGTLQSWQSFMTPLLQTYGNTMYCIDNQDMTMQVIVQGPPISLVLQSIIQNGILGMRPLGVAISNYSFPSSGGGAIQGAAKVLVNARGKLS